MSILALDNLFEIVLPYWGILGLATIVIIVVMFLTGWRPNAKEEIRQAKYVLRSILKSIVLFIFTVLCAVGAIALGAPEKTALTLAGGLIVMELGIIWRRKNESEERPTGVKIQQESQPAFARRLGRWIARKRNAKRQARTGQQVITDMISQHCNSGKIL